MSYSLQIRGQLIAPNGDRALQTKLDKFIPYQYIVNWFREHEGRLGVANRLLIIKSGTGSGKSITIPTEMYINLVRDRSAGGDIICTQPRVITAIDNVKKIIGIPQYASVMKLGENIGWSTRRLKTRPYHGLLSATIGILAQQLMTSTDEEIMQSYKYIIIDEAHERPIAADMVICMLKRMLWRNVNNPNCPFVVLMSATIDPHLYARYFLSPPALSQARETEPQPTPPAVDNIVICGEMPPFERTLIWAENDVADVRETICAIVARIQTDHPAPIDSWDPAKMNGARESDDVLIFVPGNEMATAIIMKLRETEAARAHPINIVLLNRNVVVTNTIEYQHLDIPLCEINRARASRGEAPYERRVIISTSVAETGKTFASVRYVIDCGVSRESEYNPHDRISTIVSRPAQKSRIKQRFGRVGRIFPGTVYALYTRETYDALQDQQYPEIITSSLYSSILDMILDQQRAKALAHDVAPYFRISDIDMLTAPSPDSALDAIDHMRNLGFVSRACPKFAIDIGEFLSAPRPAQDIARDCVGITRMGRVAHELSMACIGIAPEASRIILAGFAWGIRPFDLISIAAWQNVMMIDTLSSRVVSECAEAAHNIIAQSQLNDHARILATHKILGDTFCDAIVIGAAIDSIITNTIELEGASDLALPLDAETMVNFVITRDSIVGALAELGMDIYRGDSIVDDILAPKSLRDGHRDRDRMADILLRYKKCIYDGCRDSVITRESSTLAQYVTSTGLAIDPDFSRRMARQGIDGEPRAIACLWIAGAQSMTDPRIYVAAPSPFFTTLDGYVGHDTLFSR